jgi:hypothetical protein
MLRPIALPPPGRAFAVVMKRQNQGGGGTAATLRGRVCISGGRMFPELVAASRTQDRDA